MPKPPAKILIVGESVYKIHTHFKGFASYETGYATLGLDNFISRFADTGLDINFMPNQEVSLRFPSSLVAMQAYVVAGLWIDSYLLWLGIAVTVLILLGLFLFPAVFWLWMAIFGGGSLIATGFYVRHFWP